MSNVVTLTFAGDATSAKKAFGEVGSASKDMSDQVKKSGESFDAAAERSDALDTKAMGFRDTLTGIQDGAAGVKRAAAGDWGFETLLLLGTGIGDFASGLTNFLIPAAKSMKTAQLGLNASFLASPITWIVLGIAAIVAAFVILWIKCEGFRNFWKRMWGDIVGVAKSAWSGIQRAAAVTWDYLKAIPGKIRNTFSSIAQAISAPFKSAFNAVASAWNRTVGSLSWSVPSWVPFIGGNSISAPTLPTFHAGGRVPGAPGQYVPIMAMSGESVSATGGSDSTWVQVDLEGLGDVLLPMIARSVERRGGRVTALGVKVVAGSVRT